MRIVSPREKGIAICGGQSPEDGDLPLKCAERFLKKLSELEIQAEEWKIVPWVWENFCNISDLFTLFGLWIKKRANCAKNNKPKSGGLFLVNARTFPEHAHLSSRATFSERRAWLEATPWPTAYSGAINFPWQPRLVLWSVWHDIMLIDCAMKKTRPAVPRTPYHRVVFEVFELSSVKEGRVSLLFDVFPCSSWFALLWSRCERRHGERRRRRLFWVALGGNELRNRRIVFSFLNFQSGCQAACICWQ